MEYIEITMFLGYDAMQVGRQAVSKELVASIYFPENLDSRFL